MIAWAPILAIVTAAAGQSADAACPTVDAVVAELERLGTAPAVAALGRPEVVVRAGRMQVTLHGLDGKPSGAREISAPATCPERAAVAATLLSAWVGAWNTGSSPKPLGTARGPAAAPSDTGPTEPSPPATSAAAALTLPIPATTSEPATPLASPASASEPAPATGTATTAPPPAAAPPAAAMEAPAGLTGQAPHTAGVKGRGALELGGFGFGAHDGDVGAWGGGLQLGYRLPGWLGIDAVLSGIANRERDVPPGVAAYRSYGFAVGPSLRAKSKHVFGDLGILPEVTLLTAEGRNLKPGNQILRWGLAADARLRLGLVLGGWRPFAFVAGSVALRAERLHLEDHPEQGIDLSRWNASVGAGVTYFWGSAE